MMKARFAGAALLLAGLSSAQTTPAEWATRIKGDFGVQVRWDEVPRGEGPDSSISAKLLSLARSGELSPYLKLLHEELGRYSANFRANLGLANIRIVSAMSARQRYGDAHWLVLNCGGLAAWTSPPEIVLVYGDEPRGELDLRRTLHHEIFHSVWQSLTDREEFDAAWARLNPPGFQYRVGKPTSRDSTRLTHPARGFVTAYGMSALEEDMAETASMLPLPECSELREKWMADDPFLDRKVRVIQQTLAALETAPLTPADWARRFEADYGIAAVYRGELISANEGDQALYRLAEWTASYLAVPETGYRSLTKYMAQVLAEIAKYSTTYRQRSNLGNIVFCSGLRVGLTKDGATTASDQRDSWMDSKLGVLFLDVKMAEGAGAWSNHQLHTALFHLLTGSLKGERFWDDEGWKDLNSPGFEYGRAHLTGDWWVLDHPAPGFLDRRAMFDVSSDMAEMAAARLVPAEAKLLDEWRAQDPILQAKYARLMDLLAPYLG
ncbi:MAG: hypothetical protein HYR64_08230 [Fimbriimonas ginsengisoli]|uniref:DUF1570 domain-containing protein n=1 Tax=Fimbriimonas ginsengisoli TaxID=1005039 RepID=A0A931LYG6_FIMGI|nr:hypothetical protein [Fimbriimonas ginsengisoli]